MSDDDTADADACDHYDAQVAVRMVDIEVTDPASIERYCDWCGNLPDIALIKSERESIVFCEECRDIIRTLASE